MDRKEIIQLWKSGRSKESIIKSMIQRDKSYGEKTSTTEARKIIDKVIYEEVLRELRGS